MAYELAVKRGDGFMRLVVAGRPAYEEILAMIQVIGFESSTWPGRRVLADLRDVETRYSAVELSNIGTEVACNFFHLRGVASLVLPERLSRISEQAAQRNGCHFQVFVNEEKALGWLRSEPARKDQRLPAGKRLNAHSPYYRWASAMSKG